MQIPYLGLEEITKDKGLFAKQIAAEFIGTLILVNWKNITFLLYVH